MCQNDGGQNFKSSVIQTARLVSTLVHVYISLQLRAEVYQLDVAYECNVTPSTQRSDVLTVKLLLTSGCAFYNIGKWFPCRGVQSGPSQRGLFYQI